MQAPHVSIKHHVKGRPINYLLTCTYSLELPSPREKLGDASWVVRTPGSPVPASLHLLALQLKPSLSGGSALHTLSFGFNPDDARESSLVARGVLITPPFAILIIILVLNLLSSPACRPPPIINDMHWA